MAVTGLNRPDFRTIADFRKRHLAALSDLFVQVLRLCRAVGLVQFAHVAVDGTKVKANASRHEAMSYGRMKTAEPALAAEVDAWLEHAHDCQSNCQGTSCPPRFVPACQLMFLAAPPAS